MNRNCDFEVPNMQERQNAIGSLAGAPIQIKKAINAIRNQFQPIDPPQRSDWLWDHNEAGQTYVQYKETPNKRLFNQQSKNTIYIQPLEQNMGITEELKKFCEAFFKDCKIKMREAINIKDIETVKRRMNPYTNNFQLNSKDISAYLKTKLPEDGICMIGVTKIDLYPYDDWNYVYGQASISLGVGVFSFARHMYEDDDFYYNKQLADQDTIIYRACKIMAHEICHMFGIKHCIFNKCLMNGQNHPEESQKTPLQLCGICLRKLQFNIGFCFVDRYEDLIKFCSDKALFSKQDLPIYERLKKSIECAYEPRKKK